MPKPTKGPRIGGSPAHQKLILGNLAKQLFEHGKIVTTETRAYRVQPLAEHLITKAKRGTLHDRRIVAKTITDKGVLHILFTDIAAAVADRDGGYTRVTKLGNRKGDGAPIAQIEIITDPVEPKPSKKKPAKADKAEAAPVVDDEAVDEDVADEVVDAAEDSEADAAEEEAPEVAAEDAPEAEADADAPDEAPEVADESKDENP
jgi:large subunit ribosomal protein L17